MIVLSLVYQPIYHIGVFARKGWSLLPACLLAVCLFVGCASHPNHPPSATSDARKSDPIVMTVMAQLDKPYRYGGYNPKGFDCSGLVYYVYQRNGIAIPRTTLEQFRAARSVKLEDLIPGDLLFFRERRVRRPSHVGLYVGDGGFVHASTSERSVVLSLLDNPYWKNRLIGIGRYID